MVIDFHVHVFPDELAPRAVGGINAGLAEHARAVLDGTVAGLLASMDRAGIRRAVLWSVATKPTQVDPIIRWSRSVAGERIIPFGSVHPDAADPAADVAKVAAAGLKGIKLHPMYQGFAADERHAWPIYSAAQEVDLILGFHAGGDLSFPLGDDRASPGRILRVHRAFPRLRIVAAHLGGWQMWDEVARTLAGTDVYLETSYTFGSASSEQIERVLERHAPGRILFGSDSPWRDQAQALALAGTAFPDPAVRRMVLESNAERLLGLA
jgi:predicted TIM-barrel fold metal-dependent hydrolase